MNHLTKPSGLRLTTQLIESLPLTGHNTMYSENLYNKLLKRQLYSVKKRSTRKKNILEEII